MRIDCCYKNSIDLLINFLKVKPMVLRMNYYEFSEDT